MKRNLGKGAIRMRLMILAKPTLQRSTFELHLQYIKKDALYLGTSFGRENYLLQLLQLI